MIRWLACLVFLLALPWTAWGQTAQITSGDHPDFTRLVVQFPGSVDWRVGRTADGYELRLPESGTQYDLTKAFDLIQRNRLAAIWTDPQTGALHLSIACSCFAIPFEFRPGTVVIDIRDGSPPEGSEFEEALDGGPVQDLVEQKTARPKLRPVTGQAPSYDWTTRVLQSQTGGLTMPGSDLDAVDLRAASTLDLEPLRQSLIEQLSRGASAGIVDMAKPKRSVPVGRDPNPNPSVDIHSGDIPNLQLRQKGQDVAPMTATGDSCFTDEQVDVASWSVSAAAEGAVQPQAQTATENVVPKEGEPAAEAPIGGQMQDEDPIPMQFAPAMANLTGEFDHPDPEAVSRAVRFDLHIGFGAEARALLRAFPIDDADKPIWESMARISDEEPDPNPVFAGMEACDTAAALWAVLADPKVLGVGQVQKSAILRAFSALPSHLRQHFGPTLVDRFLAMQDFGTATVLRDAVTRGNPTSTPEVEMMQAAIDKASGSPGASVARLETVAAESGPSNADAMAALIIQRAELGQDVSYDQVRAIEEYATERKGSEDNQKFQQALTLGYAASGDFDSAFSNLANGPDAAGTLWRLLANAGPESAVLNFAILEDGLEPPRSARSSASLVADRLLRLGLADQAARWLAVAIDPPSLLAARIAAAKGEPQQALTLLGDQTTPAAIQVRMDALNQLGDEPAIAALFAELGMTENYWNSVSRTQNWRSLAADGPDIWKAAAATLTDQPQKTAPTAAGILPPDGPLAQGQALIDESASTRDAIAALLNSVKSPKVPLQ